MKINKFIDKTFLRFIIVGVINTLFGTTLMFVLYNVFNCSYWVSSASNYFFGSILSYFLNKYFTFNYKKKSKKTIICFVFNITLCYLIAYGFAKPVVVMILHNCANNVQENIAMIAGMGIFVILNYIGQRTFVFKKKDE